jgi:opacity protein-like surface antigen
VSLAIIAAVLLGSTAAYGQDRKVQVNIGGGFTATVGQVHDHLGNGGNFMLGVTFNVNPHVGIQAEYGYTTLGSKEVDFPVVAPVGSTVPISAGAHMHQYTFNAIVHFGDLSAKARPYAIVGGGIYDRVVQLTSPGTGITTVCDPWWYVCYPVAVPVTNILGERSSTDFGMNYGVGVDIRLGGHVDAYAEARFHYIWGPKLSSFSSTGTLPPGVSDQNANGKFFPITFGIRF